MTHAPIKLLIDIPRVHGAGQGDKIAVAFEGRDLTYAQMDRRSDQVAGMLQKLGVKPGDRVAWLLPLPICPKTGDAGVYFPVDVTHVGVCHRLAIDKLLA